MYYRLATNFTVRTGTIFHRSQIVLHNWLLATQGFGEGSISAALIRLGSRAAARQT
jgi:hypothetical protein